MSGLTYYDLPPHCSDPAQSRFVIIPVPFDATSTWKKGADKGPEAIRNASAQVELYDIETETEVYTAGIAEHPAPIIVSDSESMIGSVCGAATLQLSRGAVPVVLGGEHSVTVGAVAAASAQYRDLSVLQLDAHADLRDEYEGSQYNHACVMARVRELCPSVAVGVRSMDASERESVEPVFYAHRIAAAPGRWMEDVIGQLTGDVYITIDLDVFDPSIMPSTGTPEPGGLGWYQVLGLLKAVAEHRRIIGFDIVELCPDGHHAAEFLAAKLCYKLMSYIGVSQLKPEISPEAGNG